MPSNLLFVPYRKTERIEVGNVLRDVIAKEYYQTPTIFERDIQEIDTLRNDTIELEVTPQDLAFLKRYYVHLATLESKFPKDVVEFPWYGTLGYSVTGPVKIRSFIFERVNVVYNIAALYTQMAVAQDRSADEGLKKACLYFQYAASHFKYINQLSEEDQNLKLPLDLQKGTIDTLESLCLAQAQEVFWQKATADKVKDSLVARLAMQVADYYDQALSFSNRSEGLRNEWVNHITVKSAHFRASAQYRSSIIAVSNSRYGEEVARLETAQKIIDSVSSVLKFVSSNVNQELQGLKEVVNENLKRAEKDNDLIYLQPVPTNLPPILKTPAVKELPLDDFTTPFEAIKTGKYGTLLFRDLLPFYVIQTAQAFRERQEEFVNSHIITPVKALTSIMQKFVCERGLPASIEMIDEPVKIPQSIIDYSRDLNAHGGVENLKKLLDDIQKLSLEGERLLDGAKERLTIESNEDNLLRSKQGSKHWTRPTSSDAGADLLRRVGELESYLQQAKNGDKTVREQYYNIEEFLIILASPKEKILECTPSSRTSQMNPALKRCILNLKELLRKVHKLESERENFIETVVIKSTQYNILPKIISEYKSIHSTFKDLKVNSNTFEPVFDKHMENFKKDIEWIQQQKLEQRDLEDKIEEQNKEFSRLQKSESKDPQREKLLKHLNSVYIEYNDLSQNLSQGLKFYSDFISNCNKLIEDCDSFVYERRIEARDLEVELNSKFSHLGIHDTNEQVENIDTQQSSFKNPPPLIAPRAKPSRHTAAGVTWKPGSDIKFT